MSTIPQYLQFFNPRQTGPDESEFSPFPSLPTEIRQQIWQASLRRERIIKVRFYRVFTKVAGRIAFSESEPYRIVVDGYQLLSKLLRVNQEAREAALAFCRVRVPCELLAPGEAEWAPPCAQLVSGEEDWVWGRKTQPGAFYFNPEYDFLHIMSESDMEGQTLLDFLYNLKTTYDPRHIGLLNLVIDSTNPPDLNSVSPSNVDPKFRRTFEEILTQLREVLFAQIESSGRRTFGWIRYLPEEHRLSNLSYPIMPRAPTFERLCPDPRPIAPDLTRVFMGFYDPRKLARTWQNLLRRWHISPSHPIQYRLLLACTPATDRWICDREDALKYLKEEDDRFGSPQAFSEGLRTLAQAAFGFWLFPMEVAGEILEEESDYIRIRDLTGYWPDLGFSSLPSASVSRSSATEP